MLNLTGYLNMKSKIFVQLMFPFVLKIRSSVDMILSIRLVNLMSILFEAISLLLPEYILCTIFSLFQCN